MTIQRELKVAVSKDYVCSCNIDIYQIHVAIGCLKLIVILSNKLLHHSTFPAHGAYLLDPYRIVRFP